MRTLLLLSIVALAACEDSQSTTAPASARAVPTPAAQVSEGPSSQAKPIQQSGFTTVTVVTSNEYANAGGAIGGSVACPAGTTRISGGYAFTNEGSLATPPVVTQSVPFANGWFVRTINSGASGIAFKVYVLCAS